MGNIISTIDELFEILKVDSQQFKIVSIDGAMGAGKSALAREIADNLDFGVFDLDSYLSEKVPAEKKYVGTTCLKSLFRDLNESLYSGRSVIVEGAVY